ncbi:MAG: hypothetical protein JW837_13320 [Sedimentisphaerales bacterium]|nr:hypothetical protein [Sedimentisphaerales bacterium]
MKPDEKKSSQVQRDEAAVERLKQLTRKLCSNDITTARLAAYNLSWLQEDGLAILTETLTGDYSRTTKKAAAYGLRSMKGRMRKRGLEVLEKGIKHPDRVTRAACIKATSIVKGDSAKKADSQSEPESQKPQIREIKKAYKKDIQDKKPTSR